MPCNVEHVIDSASDPVVAILITTRTVACKILAGESFEIGVYEALVIAEYRAHLPRPTVVENEVAFGSTFKHASFTVDQRRLHAKKRNGCGTWLLIDRTRQRCDQSAASLCLPPGVNDRTTPIAYDA